MQLCTLQAIRECLKLQSDLKLVLVDSDLVSRSLARTAADDDECQIPPIDITHQLTSHEIVKSSEISILVDLCHDQVRTFNFVYPNLYLQSWDIFAVKRHLFVRFPANQWSILSAVLLQRDMPDIPKSCSK